MHRLKLCVGVLLVFALGTLVGSLGTRAFLKHRLLEFARGGPPGGPPEGPPEGRILRRISNDLDLADSQREKIDKILAETEAKLLDFRRKYHPEFIEILDEGISLMKAQLDDQQKEALDRLHEKMKHRRLPRDVGRGFREDEITRSILLENKGHLNVTPKQEAEIRQVLEEGGRHRHEIVSKYTEKLPKEMPSFMEEMQNHEELMERDLSAILEPEQMKEFKRLREERRDEMVRRHRPRGRREDPGLR